MNDGSLKISKQDLEKDTKDPFKAGLESHQEGRLAEAVDYYLKALQIRPDDAGVWSNMGVALRRLEFPDAGVAALRRALYISPGNMSFMDNLGNALFDDNRIEEALACHSQVVAARPDVAGAHYNYALSLREAGQFEKAIKHLSISADLNPEDAMVRWYRAVSNLHIGKFREGWDEYEIRWKIGEAEERKFSVPQWQGEDLQGKTIYIHGEQGFGDTILTSRFIPLVKKKGARILFDCRAPLHRLFSKIPGADRIIEPGVNPEEPVHYHIPVMSIPRLFNTDLSNIPPPVPLAVSDVLPAAVTDMLAKAKNDIKLGIVWSGSQTFKGNRKRSVQVREFLPLAEIPGVRMFSLQKGPREGELAECGAHSVIWEIGPHMNDFADTAAVINQLDLVLMTDSSVAHLTGTMGRPVWNMLPYLAYWLYMKDRDDSPWYPSMRLFRQPTPGDWDSVFAKVKKELEKAVSLKKKGQWPKP